jgi:hypothetical protein
MRNLRKKSSGGSPFAAFFVIPSEVEEWREWDERHGRTCREVAAREAGDERVQSLIVSKIENIERCLHFGRHDTGLFAPLIHPIINRLVPELRVLRLKHPMTFIREVQHFRRHLQHLQCRE